MREPLVSTLMLLPILAQAPRLDSPAVGGWICVAMGFLISAMGLLYGGFWLWMLIDCIIREPDRFFWVWLLIVVPFPGAIVYAVVRFFPQQDFTAPNFVRAWTRGKELARLETAAE
ncbi:MAG: hypothetical protein B7Z55_13150, partial [Planctomycetales bacterium 12-60-4]